MVKGESLYLLSDGDYYITKSGEIYSLHHYGEYPLKMKYRINKDGYPVVNLSLRGKQTTTTVHKLIALTFIPNPENKSQVNHKNGNKLDYSLSNLEWATPSENMQHAFDNGLCKPPQQAKQVIDTSTGIVYPSIKKASIALNISYSSCKKYLIGIIKNKAYLQYTTL